MSALVGIKEPSEYSEWIPSEKSGSESPAILNPRSLRWLPSRGEFKVKIEEHMEQTPGYTMIPQKWHHPHPKRNALGLVGGNEVSLPKGNTIDIESELYGITRTRSRVPAKQYSPSCPLGSKECSSWPSPFQFVERSTGRQRTISTDPQHVPTFQMFQYPGVPVPKPIQQSVYASPWRF